MADFEPDFTPTTPKTEAKGNPLAEDITSTFEVTTEDLACEVCGTPLVYSGRGRKPRFCEEHKNAGRSGGSRPRGSSPARGSAGSQVEQAVQVLGSIYEGLNLLFFVADPSGEAAREWVGNVDKLHDQNRQFLSTNPKLAKQIVKMGTSTGTAGFVAAQAMAVLPPAMIAAGAVKKRREENVRNSKPRNNPTRPQGGPATPGGQPMPPQSSPSSRAAQFDPGQVGPEDQGYSGPNAGFF